MPFKSLFAGTKVEAIDENTCDITIDMNFVIKGGPLGWLMVIVKSQKPHPTTPEIIVLQ